MYLQSYAFHNENTRGRRYPETVHPYREPFQRDRDRIIHCAAFRRLGEKMQVFTSDFGNYHRTRLTHTLEVSCIARTLGRALGLNEDLIEAAALLHDIGHPPFGHSGEEVLDTFLCGYGGFNHNAQALRIVEKLERRYANFPGLNLSREILDGQNFKVKKHGSPLLEIQVVDMADSIAYDTHDVDDSLELGLLKTEQLLDTTLWKRSAERVKQRWTNLNDEDFRHAVVHDLVNIQVNDILEASRSRIAANDVQTAADAEHLPFLILPSSEIGGQKAEAEQFLLEKIYRHPTVMMVRHRADQWIKEIFLHYRQNPERLTDRYQTVLQQEGIERAVADYICDLTDQSARKEAVRTPSFSLNKRR
jgi:dGTPase